MTNARDKANIPVLNFQSKGIDDNASSTAVTITSGSDVQIGSTNSGVGGSIDLSIGNLSSSGGITLWSPTNSAHSIGFGDGFSGTDRYRGYVEYIHSSDSLRFGTSATERMRLNSTGVGIGTSSPTEKLTVETTTGISIKGTGSGDGIIKLVSYAGSQNAEAQIRSARGNTSGTDSRLKFYTNNGTSTLERIDINDNGDISFYEDTGTTAKLFWDASTERLGLGTSSPTEVLHVVGDILATGGDFKSDANNYLGFSNDTFARFVVNDTEVFRVLSSGNVGIGEVAPQGLLHVRTADSGATVDSNADELIIENGTSGSASGISILSATNGYGNICFGDSGDNNIGVFQYDHNGNFMKFIANGGERMRITSAGSVGITTSSPSYRLDVPHNDGARLAKSNVFLGKEVTASNGQTKTIDIATNNAGSYFKVILTGVYASNAGLWTTHEYERVAVNSSTGGTNTSIITPYSQNQGNFQFQSGDFAISRPGNGVVRIVYTVNGSNNGDILLNVNVIGLGGRNVPSAISIT